VEVVVGVVGRAHGIHGEVSVQPRTDEPEVRFAGGAVLRAAPPGPGRLIVRAARRHGGRLLVAFDDIVDRGQAERLRGVRLVVDVPVDARPADPEEFYDHQLVGLTVRTTTGRPIGTVAEVRHLPAQDLLVVAGDHGPHLVPFVAAIVPAVDLASGTLTVDPPPGLLDPEDRGSG